MPFRDGNPETIVRCGPERDACAHAEPEFASAAVAAGALAYEFVYGKGLTPFLAFAKAAGARTLADGVGMLVEQAAEAFAWWRGTRPDTRRLIADLTVPLR